MLRVAFFEISIFETSRQVYENLSRALFIVQNIEHLLVMNLKVIIFPKILFFSQVLWVPDRLNTDCAVCCHRIASVSTETAVAALRDWFGAVALGPPSSGWRLKKLPGASQGFCLFLSLSYLDIPSFFPIASSVLVLPLCCSKESGSSAISV